MAFVALHATSYQISEWLYSTGNSHHALGYAHISRIATLRREQGAD